MPELPEVETIRKALEKKLVNKKIDNVFLFVKKSLKNCEEENFVKSLKGQEIKGLERIAKYLIFDLTNYWMVTHLRMEGKFYVLEKSSKTNNHNILVIDFKDNTCLLFKDFRKFATIDFFSKKEFTNFKDLPIFKKVGNEPWDINQDVFDTQISHLKSNIKSALLSQKYISGLGNIYVDEVLHMCLIHPATLCNKLNKNELKCIVEQSKVILKDAIAKGGTTIRSYMVENKKGNYQKYLKVHYQEGKPCGKNGIVKKIKVGGRGTYFCSEK